MIQLIKLLLHKINLHAMHAYPDECCGMLLGKYDGSVKVVREVLAMNNTKNDDRGRRYLITAKDYQWAEERARNEGVEILGLYHSHPDHPAEPSAFDLDHAMPVWSYIIVSVQKAQATSMRSWVLLDDRSRFKEERIDVVDEAVVLPHE